MRSWFRTASVACLLLPVLAPGLQAKGEPAGTYVVLMVTDSEGKVSYKPIADKDKTSYQKSLDETYQKAKKAYQDAKKTVEKQKGQASGKSEPVKPKVSVQKRDIKTFNEAKKIAFDLERELEKKNAKAQKNGNGNGNSGGEKNGKDQKKPAGKTDSPPPGHARLPG